MTSSRHRVSLGAALAALACACVLTGCFQLPAVLIDIEAFKGKSYGPQEGGDSVLDPAGTALDEQRIDLGGLPNLVSPDDILASIAGEAGFAANLISIEEVNIRSIVLTATEGSFAHATYVEVLLTGGSGEVSLGVAEDAGGLGTTIDLVPAEPVNLLDIADDENDVVTLSIILSGVVPDENVVFDAVLKASVLASVSLF